MLFYLRITRLQPSRLLSCRKPVLQDEGGFKSSARPLFEDAAKTALSSGIY